MTTKTKISIFALREVRYEKLAMKTLRYYGKVNCE